MSAGVLLNATLITTIGFILSCALCFTLAQPPITSSIPRHVIDRLGCCGECVVPIYQLGKHFSLVIVSITLRAIPASLGNLAVAVGCPAAFACKCRNHLPAFLDVGGSVEFLTINYGRSNNNGRIVALREIAFDYCNRLLRSECRDKAAANLVIPILRLDFRTK